MASLKEVKARIASVSSTQKITSAMKMVSSAKLKKSQRSAENIRPYQDMLNKILNNLLESATDFQSVFSESRSIKRIALVVFSSNSSLCGAFNSNVIKQLNAQVKENIKLNNENILIYPIGQKIYASAIKSGLKVQGNYKKLADKPSYDEMNLVTNDLMTKFQNKEIDKVVVVYHHFHSTSSQILKTETFLPISLNELNQKEENQQKEKSKNFATDYIIEPKTNSVLEVLLPKALRIKMFSHLLESNASEHAARVVAMQVANDNAETMIKDLTVLYNKTRQSAITNELLDIVGGAAALEN